jgi:hypothetical protein
MESICQHMRTIEMIFVRPHMPTPAMHAVTVRGPVAIIRGKVSGDNTAGAIGIYMIMLTTHLSMKGLVIPKALPRTR